MKASTDEGLLADCQYVTLILRLTLDRRGRLIKGEMVNTTDTLQQRFVGLAGLNEAVRGWLRRREQAGDNP
jgi:hypothetical protein